jgi:hypothetical protein
MHHGPAGQRCLSAMTAFLLMSVISNPGPAPWSASSAEQARFGVEWERVRGKYERALRENDQRLAAIDARERGFSADRERRADKITRDGVATVRAHLPGGIQGKGKELMLAAERAGSQANTLVDIHTAQDEYLDTVMREWGDGAERHKLRDAQATLVKNIELANSYVAAATEAAAMSTRVLRSGVLEKATQTEAAAKETLERLGARWERERAARERERVQREREAGERARVRP